MRKVCSVFVALLVSLFVYLFYRSENTVVNELVIFLFSLDAYTAVKQKVLGSLPLSGAIVFSLPGGLWVFCATTLSQEFYVKIRDHKIQVVLVPVLFAIGLELCQLLHVTHGRFDIWDIAFYLVFWLLALVWFRPPNLQQTILTPFTREGLICVACFFSVYLAHVSR